jgi:hypothetical protein
VIIRPEIRALATKRSHRTVVAHATPRGTAGSGRALDATSAAIMIVFLEVGTPFLAQRELGTLVHGCQWSTVVARTISLGGEARTRSTGVDKPSGRAPLSALRVAEVCLARGRSVGDDGYGDRRGFSLDRDHKGCRRVTHPEEHK